MTDLSRHLQQRVDSAQIFFCEIKRTLGAKGKSFFHLANAFSLFLLNITGKIKDHTATAFSLHFISFFDPKTQESELVLGESLLWGGSLACINSMPLNPWIKGLLCFVPLSLLLYAVFKERDPHTTPTENRKCLISCLVIASIVTLFSLLFRSYVTFPILLDLSTLLILYTGYKYILTIYTLPFQQEMFIENAISSLPSSYHFTGIVFVLACIICLIGAIIGEGGMVYHALIGAIIGWPSLSCLVLILLSLQRHLEVKGLALPGLPAYLKILQIKSFVFDFRMLHHASKISVSQIYPFGTIASETVLNIAASLAVHRTGALFCRALVDMNTTQRHRLRHVNQVTGTDWHFQGEIEGRSYRLCLTDALDLHHDLLRNSSFIKALRCGSVGYALFESNYPIGVIMFDLVLKEAFQQELSSLHQQGFKTALRLTSPLSLETRKLAAHFGDIQFESQGQPKAPQNDLLFLDVSRLSQESEKSDQNPLLMTLSSNARSLKDEKIWKKISPHLIISQHTVPRTLSIFVNEIKRAKNHLKLYAIMVMLLSCTIGSGLYAIKHIVCPLSAAFAIRILISLIVMHMMVIEQKTTFRPTCAPQKP